MPINRITLRTRRWGIMGSAVSVLNLWLVGYFDSTGAGRQVGRVVIPFVLLVAWLLPARFYGDDVPPTAEPTPHMLRARPHAGAD